MEPLWGEGGEDRLKGENSQWRTQICESSQQVMFRIEPWSSLILHNGGGGRGDEMSKAGPQTQRSIVPGKPKEAVQERKGQLDQILLKE